MRRLASLVATELVLVTAIAAWPAAIGSLGGPSEWSWHGIDAWYARAAPETIVAVVGLVVVAMLLGWLVAATILQLSAELLPAVTRLRSFADALSPGFLRSVGRTVVDATISACLVVGPLPAGVAQTNPPTSSPAPETASLTPLVPVPTEDPSPQAPAPTRTETPPPPDPATVVVQPGDSFWSIVEHAIEAASGHEATDRQVDAYWRVLMASNQDRLVVEGVFDLIYPGQVLVLPDLPGSVLPELPATT